MERLAACHIISQREGGSVCPVSQMRESRRHKWDLKPDLSHFHCAGTLCPSVQLSHFLLTGVLSGSLAGSVISEEGYRVGNNTEKNRRQNAHCLKVLREALALCSINDDLKW